MKNLMLISLLSLLTFAASAQKMDSDDKQTNQRADFLFKAGRYSLALPLYQQLVDKYPSNMQLKFDLGVCYNAKTDEHEKAIPLLEEVLAKKPKTKEIHFQLGRAYHYNYEFEKAIASFETHLKSKPKNKEQTERLIEYCRNGLTLTAIPTDVKIENIGSDVNTHYSEYVPCIAADESVLIFTYRGERSTGGLMNDQYEPDPNGDYFEDVFITYKVGENWLTPERIGTNINGFGYDANISLSPSGQKLFLYISYAEDGGDIYVSYLDGEYWTAPERLLGDVNTKFWEGSCSISADEKTLYFSSERPGGLGGKDIYKAILQNDGTWGEVENLGPNINTVEDDDAPYIHPDGTMLHFSSKAHNSMGGFDIFRSDITDDGKWGAPGNLGHPVNTPDNDSYYTLSADGLTGYFSSGRKGGFGQQDIYTVRPGIIGKKTKNILVKGIVSLNDTAFVEADVKIFEKGKEDGEPMSKYQSNSKTGKYLLNLKAGKDYKIVFEYNDLEDQVKEVLTAGADTFSQSEIDVRFYTADYVKPQAKVIAEVKQPEKQPEVKQPEVKQPEVKQPETKSKRNYKDTPYEWFVQNYPDDRKDGLEFRVQIAAYRLSSNFSYSKLLSLGTVDKNTWGDGITRFTMGNYTSLKEAEAFRQQVIKAGVKDAFVCVIYEGKRLFVWELPAIFGDR